MTCELKHRWSISHNYLTGITTGDWWRLLQENRFQIAPAYWHRACFITLVSLMNAFYRRREEKTFNPAIAAAEIKAAPVFVLGHWRSGTTHLHYLLAQDTEQFAFANTYQVTSPHSFLTTEEVNSRRFAGMVPETRPMDNMSMSFQSPQEDEFAYCLKCFKSMYLGISFPKRTDHYERYLTFDGVAPEEIEEWKQAFVWFAKKLTVKYGKKLLFKSPSHTARVRLLLELFPDARFVHIHRNPYDVFRSFRHYYDTTMWYTYLQKPDMDAVNDIIINRYQTMYEAYFRDRVLIPDGRLHEMSFSDLETEPLQQIDQLYDALDLPAFDRFKPRLEKYLETIRNYEKNRFSDLEPAIVKKINTSWSRCFEEWGYEKRSV